MSARGASPKPPGAPFFIGLGLGVVALVFGGTALWSIFAPIDGAVVAAGQVVVESNRKTVQHLEGGTVREILVREGETVGAGAVLARLDDTVQTANVALVDGQLTELYARRARLETERDGRDAVMQARGAADIIAGDLFADRLAGQRKLFAARRETRITQISLLEERIVQQRKRIDGLDAQIRSLRNQQLLIEDELAGVRKLHDRGYVPLTRIRALEREAWRLRGERGARTAGVAEATSIIAEARLEVERLEESDREEAIRELRDVEVSIAELEEQRVTALDALRRTEILAPQGGRVLNLVIHTVGGVIAPGAPLMEIVPDGDRLRVAARVAPQDVDNVRPGQETLVRFSAFGSRRTPEAAGVVRDVSADSLADQTTGAPFYLVLVDIPEGAALADLLDGRPLLPGMPVEAFIRTGSNPAISYLLKPLADAIARSMREE
ncbi:MAG: HlyD family type I secretion periplasmic adaptor subunit [Dongiaceae bacterium]